MDNKKNSPLDDVVRGGGDILVGCGTNNEWVAMYMPDDDLLCLARGLQSVLLSDG